MKPRAMKGSLFRQWAQREVCSLEYVIGLICADDFQERAPNPDIIVSKGSVSNENTGGDGSGLGDVGIEVFIDGDVA